MQALNLEILTGFDLQSIQDFKVKKLLHKNRSIFSGNELEYSYRKKSPLITLTGIFCTKEAFIKAVSKYQNVPTFFFTDIEILHEINGRPRLCFYQRLHDFIKEMGLCCDVSISHSGDIAAAQVILWPGSYHGK